MSSTKKLEQLIGEMRRMGHLPALDKNVSALCDLGTDDAHMADLTAIIMRDPALTSSILSAANSAAYRPRVPIKTVSGAVIMLGQEKVKSLALGLAIFRQSRRSAKNRELYRLFVCSYFAGSIALAMARQAGLSNPEEAFVLGLLNQLPRLLLANCFPVKFQDMEEMMSRRGLSLNEACEKVFGLSYSEITAAIAERWNLPEDIRLMFRAGHEEGRDVYTRSIAFSCQVSDMLFGNVPAGADALVQAEEELRDILGLGEFTLPRFLEFTCESDDNMSRFFGLTRKDVEMLLKIAEWGKVSPAEITKHLTSGYTYHDEEVRELDPRVLIGHFLSELMMGVRKKRQINDVLMIAQEAIYRCLTPAGVFTVFVDKQRHLLTGRLYAGYNVLMKADDFKVPLDKSGGGFSRFLSAAAGSVKVLTAQSPELGGLDLVRSMEIEHALVAPILVFGKPIGLYFIGRGMDRPYSSEEKLWVEAIAGHVGLAFEQVDQSGLHR